MPGMGGVQRRKATRHKPGVAVWLSGAGIIGSLCACKLPNSSVSDVRGIT